jgi:hypothetical protein
VRLDGDFMVGFFEPGTRLPLNRLDGVLVCVAGFRDVTFLNRLLLPDVDGRLTWVPRFIVDPFLLKERLPELREDDPRLFI